MKSSFAVLRSRGVKVALITAACAVAPAVFADPTAIEAAVTAAQTAGKSSVELTTTGMIQIVALVVGVGLVVSLLKRV